MSIIGNRRNIPVASWLATGVVALGLLVTTGCGASSQAADGTPASSGVCDINAARVVHKNNRVYLGWPDVTYSTRNTRASYLPDMVTFVRMAAQNRSPLLMDAFTGAPQNTTDWPVSCDFSATPAAFGGNAELENAFLRSQATKLEPKLRQLLNKPAVHSGSPLLNVFALSAYAVSSYPGATACIAVFTDGGVIEPGFNVNKVLGPAEQDALVARWAPRLKELRGSKVIIVGVGRGTPITVDQMEYVHTVLDKLLGSVGAELVAFDTRLSSSVRC